MAKVAIMRRTGKPKDSKHQGIWKVHAGNIIEEVFQGIEDGIKAAGDTPVIYDDKFIIPQENNVVIFGYGRREDNNPKHWLQNWKHSIITKVEARGGKVFCWDGGFFKSLRNFKYFRFGMNSPLRNGVFLNENSTPDRWNMLQKEFNIPYNMDRRSGNRVLILAQPFEGFSMNMVKMTDIFERPVTLFQKLGKQVQIKPHPNTKRAEYDEISKFCDTKKITLIPKETPLYETFDDVCLTVTFNSTVAVESALYGIPTIATDSLSHAYPVCHNNVNNAVSNYEIFDRNQWIHDLSHTMWSANELATGELWNRFKEYNA